MKWELHAYGAYTQEKVKHHTAYTLRIVVRIFHLART